MGMTVPEYAKHRDVTPSAVRKALKAERISLDADGSIDPVIADEEWEANTSHAHARPNGRRGNPQPTGSMAETLRRKTEAYTQYLELKTAKLAGTLLDRARTESVVASLAMQFRDQFMAFCQREAPSAAAECGGDPAKLRRYLDKAAREELARMADGAIRLEEMIDAD